MSQPSSQGSYVSWKGTTLGRVTSWKVQPGTAHFEDTTSVVSPIVGTGMDARVRRQCVCTSIDGGSVDVAYYGGGGFTRNDIGSKGTVVVTAGIGSFSFDAFLETFDVAGSVGEFIKGTARFRLSGV